jgi:hypothetical protein
MTRRRWILAAFVLLLLLVAFLLLGPCPPPKPVPADAPLGGDPPIVNHEAPADRSK